MDSLAGRAVDALEKLVDYKDNTRVVVSAHLEPEFAGRTRTHFVIWSASDGRFTGRGETLAHAILSLDRLRRGVNK